MFFTYWKEGAKDAILSYCSCFCRLTIVCMAFCATFTVDTLEKITEMQCYRCKTFTGCRPSGTTSVT